MKSTYLLLKAAACFLLLFSSLFLKANHTNLTEDKVSNVETHMMCDRMMDSLALVVFYNATDGADWTTTWDLNAPMTTWNGVILNADGCIIELNLDNNNLVGYIADELGELSNLTILDLSNNQLSGNIPDFSNLPNLTQLVLFNNQLNGNIPDFSNLPNLTQLNLGSNHLNGNIPDFSNLPNLTYLSLQDNRLSDNIPNFSNLPNLTHFSLASNQLSGNIPDFSNLPNLTLLHLNNNILNGCFPAGLGNFCGINYNFTNNPDLPGGGDFDAFCSNDIGSCNTCADSDSLALVALYNATDGANWTTTWDLSTQISTWFGVYLTNDGCVVELDLEYNNLVGYIPDELGELSSMTDLYLAENQLSGNIPDFSNLTSISLIWLSDNQLSGNIPDFSNLPNLRYLFLHYNQFNGNIPNFSNLPSLEYLYLYHNQLSGNIPDFSNLPNLSGLLLQENQLSGCFPTELNNLCGFFYDFTNNPGLPGGGDFDAFCNDGTGDCNALPIQLLQFTGKAIDNADIQLNWSTETEQESNHFNIQHSTDGKTWTKLGTIQAAGTSTDRQSYQFLHKKAQNGQNSYRLEQFDTNGQSTFSPTVLVELKSAKSVMTFQNPVNNELVLTINSAQEQKSTFSLYHLNGQLITNRAFNLSKGQQTLTWDVSGLSKGLYLMKYMGEETQVLKIVKE